MPDLQHFSKIEFQCFLPLVLNGVYGPAPAPPCRLRTISRIPNSRSQVRQRLVFGFLPDDCQGLWRWRKRSRIGGPEHDWPAGIQPRCGHVSAPPPWTLQDAPSPGGWSVSSASSRRNVPAPFLDQLVATKAPSAGRPSGTSSVRRGQAAFLRGPTARDSMLNPLRKTAGRSGESTPGSSSNQDGKGA